MLPEIRADSWRAAGAFAGAGAFARDLPWYPKVTECRRLSRRLIRFHLVLDFGRRLPDRRGSRWGQAGRTYGKSMSTYGQQGSMYGQEKTR